MPTIDIEKTGENIKKMRIDKNITVEVIADTMGVSKRAVFKWQEGRSVPSIDNLVILAKVFETTIDEIIAIA